MAGKAVVNKIQLGDSATATQNFVLQTNVDGTAKLARGNDGATTQDILTVDASGVVTATNGLLAKGAVGYSAGAGGSVTQATSKATAVTLNTLSGQITMNNAALAANTTVVFAFNNSLITANDVVVVNVNTAAGDNYQAWCYFASAGTCSIALRNISAGSRSEAVGLNFAVIKGAIA